MRIYTLSLKKSNFVSLLFVPLEHPEPAVVLVVPVGLRHPVPRHVVHLVVDIGSTLKHGKI